MIEVKNLYHDYEGKGNYAVENISFEIGKGEIFGFLGPSGAGKSTVQNIMTGLLALQKGQVLYEGKTIKEKGQDFFNHIGVSFEQPNLYSKLTGYEHLKYYAGLFSVPTLDPMELLDAVDLREAANKKASDYSKGMKQRLTLARALINQPQILFLDEPTSGLDPTTSAKICDLILNQKKRGAAIFLTTHHMELADKLCDTVAFLYNGKIAAKDAPSQLKLQYGKKTVEMTYEEENLLRTKTFDIHDAKGIAMFLEKVTPLKIHSQEATLEEIFLKITGKELRV